MPKIKERLQNLEGEHKPIRSDISDLESRQNSLSSDINAAVSRLDANEKKGNGFAFENKQNKLLIS